MRTNRSNKRDVEVDEEEHYTKGESRHDDLLDASWLSNYEQGNLSYFEYQCLVQLFKIRKAIEES